MSGGLNNIETVARRRCVLPGCRSAHILSIIYINQQPSLSLD
ncbi:hypothetical protein OAV88_02355 [bacterium]|nr:hypothetical protein [bacterium]